MSNVDQLLDTAFTEYNLGHFDKAESLARDVLGIQPSHGDALYLLGLIAFKAGALEPAAELLYQGVKLYPDMENYALALASVLQKQGRLDEALSFYEKYKNNPAVLSQIGLIYAGKGQDEWAKSAFKEALKKDKNAIEASLGLALLAKKQGNITGAERLLLQAQTLGASVDVLFQLAVLYRQKGQFDKALKYINQAADMAQTPSILNERGLILESLGQEDAALQNYIDATELNAYYADAYANQGNIYQKQQKMQLAEDAYKRALAQDPKFLQAHHNLGVLLYNMGRKNEALEHYREAIILNPKHVPSIYNLAVALEDIGEFSEAAGLYFNALTLGMKDPILDLRIAAALTGLYESGETGQKQAVDFAKGWVKNFPDNEIAKHTWDALTGHKSADMKKYTRQLYDAFASIYDETILKLDSSVMDTALKLLGNNCYKKVLDLACGTGTFALKFKNNFNTIIGVDLSKKMLQQAAQKNIYKKLVHASIEEYLTSTKQRFDLIVALEMTGYLPDLSFLFKGVQTHLTKQGVFIFSAEIPLRAVSHELAPNGRYLYALDFVQDELNQAGMKALKIENINLRKEGTTYAEGFVIMAALK